MDKEKLNSRCRVYTFHDIPECLTHVFLINGKRHVFVIDTYCGPDCMVPILNDIATMAQGKEIVVINTHYHWDHVWGNCAFRDAEIIAHSLCKTKMEQEWERMMTSQQQFIRGKVEPKFPTITFNERLVFEEEGITLEHTPGHTSDSITVYSSGDRIVFVGDNLERPKIYLEEQNVDTYVQTISRYRELENQRIMAGHSLDLSCTDIQANLESLLELKGK
ncbi:MAG TPA: MBL fold metallo-hydrolase [Bacillota bacterium]